MYAIVEIAGQQFKVEEGQEIFVHRLEGEEGANITFNQVLLVDQDGQVKVGTPVVEGANVDVKIVAHTRGEKVKIFKKKRRKSYQKESGHRQDLSKVLIEKITF
ncbi:MAG: 50S ribosomal protein L21 [Bacteroidales bacterium]|nr:50S ribosomal protein L21 [Bacteroidales bacterium]